MQNVATAPQNSSVFWRYGLPVVLVAVALSLAILLERIFSARFWFLFLAAVMDRRANAVKDFLVSLGVSTERVKTISYGKERPFCTEHGEPCWQQNRRGHLACDNCISY